MPIDWNTVSILATIAAFFGGGGFVASQWFRKEFDGLKSDLREIINDHEIANQKQFEKIRERLIVIETKAEINRHDIQQRN